MDVPLIDIVTKGHFEVKRRMRSKAERLRKESQISDSAKEMNAISSSIFTQQKYSKNRSVST